MFLCILDLRGGRDVPLYSRSKERWGVPLYSRSEERWGCSSVF